MESAQKMIIGSKANALGDVRNLLHLRPTAFPKQNSNSSVKPFYSNKNENGLSLTSRKSSKKHFAADKSVPLASFTDDENDDDTFEFHNHILCEEANAAFLDNLLPEYRLSEQELEILSKTVKKFKFDIPFLVPSIIPFKDIKLPTENKSETINSSLFDACNFIIPDIPEP